MSHSLESNVRQDVNLKEHHRHSGKGRELYFVPMIETLSISPTTFTKSVCMEICFVSAMYFGLVEVKCGEECTY